MSEVKLYSIGGADQGRLPGRRKRKPSLRQAMRSIARAGFEVGEVVMSPTGEYRFLRMATGGAWASGDARSEVAEWARGRGYAQA